MIPGNRHRLALTGTVAALVLFVVLGAVTVAALGPQDLSWAISSPNADTCPIVSEPGDSGLGTLRDCMLRASAGDTITFDPAVFPLGSPVNIMLATALPYITAGELTIDASSAGVILDGSGLASGNGFHIFSNANEIKGLQIQYFPEHGVRIGVGASDNVIGGINASPGVGCSGDCNLISGNQEYGVLIEGTGTTGNTVSGNLIGLDASGTADLGNGSHGVTILIGAQHNTIGGTAPGERNIVSGNGASGVRFDHIGTSGNIVIGNYIGTDISGTTAVPNTHPGVAIAGGATENRVGGATPGEGNLISGNDHNGIHISDHGTTNNAVIGNLIGTDAAGTGAVPNTGFGIMIADGASDNVIGGPSEAERNIITYNYECGLYLVGGGTDRNVIQGNWIGVDVDGTRDVAVNVIAYSPAYATDQTIFVGTNGQGIFKTTDGGAHWNEVNSGLSDLNIRALAVSPDYGTDGTLFAGTLSDLFKSTDGGASWAIPPPEVVGWVGFYDLALSPNYASDQTLLVGNNPAWNSDLGYTIGGVWISTDGGATWENLAPAAGMGLSLAPAQSSIHENLPVELWGLEPQPGLVESEVGIPLLLGPEAPGSIEQDEGYIDGYAVAFSPDYASDETLFVGTRGSNGSLFKSEDSGATWSLMDTGLDGSDVRRIVVSPGYGSDQILFAMDTELEGARPYRTTNGGASWAELTSGLPGDDSLPLGFALSPGFAADEKVFASFGYPGMGVRGFFRSADGGDTWIEAAPGIQHQASVGIVAVSPNYTSDGELLLSARWNGLLLSTDEGDNWVYANGDLTEPGNAIRGISLQGGASDNLIGGAAPGEGNLVSNNGNEGIVLEHPGTSGNIVAGNHVGTDASGAFSLGNAGSGVVIREGATENTVGGDSPAPGGGCSSACNLISGNGDDGVTVDNPGTSNNTIEGNYVGTDLSGSHAIPNIEEGASLWDASSNNLIRNNLISGNGDNGIGLTGGSSYNTVVGNYVGTDASGTSALANGYCGLALGDGATHNSVGGSTPAERNLISGNTVAFGIAIWDGDSGNNTISGNYIGMDASGTSTIPNGHYGIYVPSSNNTIGGQNHSPGGDCSGECNLVSGSVYGIGIMGAGATDNVVTGNYIGTDMSGSVAIPGPQGGNLDTGVFVGWSAAGNRLGGATPGERNVIAGMVQLGPDFDAPFETQIVGNYIGLDATGTACLARSYHGIDLGGWGSVVGGDTPAEGNRICGARHDGIAVHQAGNLISHNEILGSGEEGVTVTGAESLTNTLTCNSIHDNGGLGINLIDGGNTELPAPIIEEYDLAAGTASGSACINCTVWLFSDEYGEGQWCEASDEADGSGRWSINKGSAFIGPELTATATDSAGNTSEFGQDWPGDPPPPPLISSPVCGVTNQPRPLFAGFAQMGSTVQAGSAALGLGETTADDQNRWWLAAEQALAEGSHVITATATTSWGTSGEAELDLTVDSNLCFDPVGVTFTQLSTVQHPRDPNGCADPAHDLEIALWPTQLVTVKVPVRDAIEEIYIEVNSIRYDLSDPDADGVFTAVFATPSGGTPIIALSADCGEGDDTMLIGAIIDPDGYVYNADITASTGITHTIPGVTLTLYVSDTVRTRWLQWNAELYDQLNPQVTGDDGYFSFFTPPGAYRLVANGEAVGYPSYQSPVLTVVDEPIRHNVPLYFAQGIYLPLVLRSFP